MEVMGSVRDFVAQVFPTEAADAGQQIETLGSVRRVKELLSS